MKPLSIFDSAYRLRRPSRARRILNWLESCPGGWSTLILIACFAAGMWAAWAIWGLVKCCRP